MFALTSPPDQGAQVAQLKFRENRLSHQLHQHTSYGSGHGEYQAESRYPHYGPFGGLRGGSAAPTLDLTEPVLAAVCSFPSLKSITIDKTTLLETEAAALARLSELHELALVTNSSAQPLRRPLVSLMLNGTPQLRVLKLSYIRDTTAELALCLPRLPHLTRLTFQYAYWGESGAGERIMAGLGKHARQLAELRLYECCVNDGMLRLISAITSLRVLHVQDEDAPEESCPTNKGLVRITQLRRLEELELFGEELRLDEQLLASLSRLPSLRHVAMAGLDELRTADGEAPPADGADELNAEVQDMELSSAMGDDESSESTSGNSVSLDEVTSRPGNALRSRSPATGAGSGACSSAVTARGGAGAAAGAAAAQQQPQQKAQPDRAAGAGEPSTSGGDGGAAPTPLHVLRRLDTLRLYGPSSAGAFPPPLALLLPQPALRALKLSACASHANLRALLAQSGLCKLIVSHTAVAVLYPPPGAEPLPQYAPDPAPARAPSCSGPGQPAGGGSSGSSPAAGASILGFHCEVAAGLQALAVLRVKDLPGLCDAHLADLAAALCRLPGLAELKLRDLGLVSDAGVAALAGVTQLRRLKLYSLGDGVTELGVAHLAASLPCLEEIKVKDCRRVGPTLRSTIAAYRAAAGGVPQQQQQQVGRLLLPVVRYGAAECVGGRCQEAVREARKGKGSE